jgi:hypothetical protein
VNILGLITCSYRVRIFQGWLNPDVKLRLRHIKLEAYCWYVSVKRFEAG